MFNFVGLTPPPLLFLINIINVVGSWWVRATLGRNEITAALKIKHPEMFFTACWSPFTFVLNARCRALPVGVFTHFKFRACFHLRAGRKTFASLKRSQMWWKIQVADFRLMHSAVLSCSFEGSAGRKKYKWNYNNGTELRELKITLFILAIGRCRDVKKKRLKSRFFFFCLDAYHRADLCQTRGETPQLEAAQRPANSCEITSSGSV